MSTEAESLHQHPTLKPTLAVTFIWTEAKAPFAYVSPSASRVPKTCLLKLYHPYQYYRHRANYNHRRRERTESSTAISGPTARTRFILF